MMAMVHNISGLFGGDMEGVNMLGGIGRSSMCVSKRPGSMLFSSHGQLYSQFGPNCMRDLVYSVIIGNQIIVRTSPQLVALAESILDLLQVSLRCHSSDT
jgi:hypothetical protein